MMGRKPTYSKEQYDIAVNAYIAGLSARKAAALIGARDTTLLNELKHRDIQSRNLSVSHQQYHFNEHFFDNLDTEEKVYWLGFLTADVTMGRNEICLRLASKDRAHLEKFKRILSSDHPILEYTSKVLGKIYPYCRVTLISPHMFNRLNQLGITTRRAFSVEVCTEVPPELIRHYWRGFMDGNGTVIATKRPELSVTGSKPIIESFRIFISKYITTNNQIVSDKSVWRARYHGINLAQLVARLLYGDATIFLQRKFEHVQQILQNSPEPKFERITLRQPIPYKVACA